MREKIGSLGAWVYGAALLALSAASGCDSSEDEPAGVGSGGTANAGGAGEAGASSGFDCHSDRSCGERDARCVGDSQIQRTRDVGCTELCSGPCSGTSCEPDGAPEDCPEGTSCREQRVSLTGYTAVCDGGQGGSSGDFEPCGSGTTEPGETCDDGNREAGDGCSEACRVEPGWSCPLEAPCQRLGLDASCEDACWDRDACIELESGVACVCPDSRPEACVEVSFRGLTSPEGWSSCEARAVSGDGLVVVGGCSRSDPNNSELRMSVPVIWTLGAGVRELADAPEGCVLTAANADGSVLVGSDAQGRALRLNGSEVEILAEAGAALAISADGSVVVGHSENQAFRWTDADGLTLLEGPNGELESYALGVNAGGTQLVGVVREAGHARAVRWNAAGEAELLPVPDDATDAEATALSDDGSVIIGTLWFEGETQAVRWTDAGFEVLSGATPSQAYAASADGSRIVGSAGHEPAIWSDAGEFQSLRDALTGPNLEGWLFDPVASVSADGRVVAGSAQYTGTEPQSPGSRAFIALLP